jgi:hypothetical protein
MSSSNDISVFAPILVQYSLIQDTNGLLLAAGSTHNILGVNPLLGAPASNGGQTQTIMPLPGSPALGHGNPALAAGLTTDQRGLPRIVNGKIDIGAVQIQAPAGSGHRGQRPPGSR